MEKEFDNVNNPKHYAGSTSLECIDVMCITFGKNSVCYFCLCNAFKYMWRYKNKNGEEDLKKAKWYLDWIDSNIEDEELCDFRIKEKYDRLMDIYNKIINSCKNL